MSAFECESTAGVNTSFGNRVKDECIIAFKVYDFCRQQDCLTIDALGPVRALETTVICGYVFEEGEIINPPEEVASVSIENVCVKKVIVSDKTKNPFRNGFWDITLKYIFVYRLVLREADGVIFGVIPATSIFTKKITLFGSVGTDVTFSTDLLCDGTGTSFELNSDPFVLVESKAVGLSAELIYPNRRFCCGGDDEPIKANEIGVTIGLFTIIKLFRLVNLSVKSSGFCLPQECEEISPLNPCESFENLDFPMDIFAPPQKAEFLAGISSNIPHNSVAGVTNNCGCSEVEGRGSKLRGSCSSCGF